VVGHRVRLKCLQGKGVVNSISLKEARPLPAPRELSALRCGVDRDGLRQQGQADSVERKVSICAGPTPADREVAFRPKTSFSIPTSLPLHRHRGACGYANAYIESVRRIKATLPTR